MIFLHSDFFNRIFNRINKFWKGDANIYFKQITFFEKKKKIVKIIRIFFLIFFKLVLLNLNNHR